MNEELIQEIERRMLPHLNNEQLKELKNVLDYVFGFKDKLDNVGVEDTEQKFLLRKAVIAFAYKMYLDMYFAALKAEKEKE